MTITQLEYAITLSQTLNFAKASKLLFITQPTLSMQIKKLEESIGTTLFDRSKNPIMLTDDGRRFIQQSKIVLSEYRKLKDVISKNNELAGEFKIGVIPSVAPGLIPQFLKSFIKENPKVDLVIEEIQTETIIQKLKNDEIDAGILATPLHDPQIIERLLYNEPFVVFLNPEHELLCKHSIMPQELDVENIWLMDQGHCLRNQILKLCSIKKNKSHINFKGGSLETIKNLILKGQGLSVLPLLSSKDVPQKLIRPFKSDRILAREISLVHARSFLKEKHLDALEKNIIDTLSDELDSPKKRSFKIIPP